MYHCSCYGRMSASLIGARRGGPDLLRFGSFLMCGRGRGPASWARGLDLARTYRASRGLEARGSLILLLFKQQRISRRAGLGAAGR